METREEKRKEVGRRGGKDGEGHELKKRNGMWKNCLKKKERVRRIKERKAENRERCEYRRRQHKKKRRM
jgi:hypothetical protein